MTMDLKYSVKGAVMRNKAGYKKTSEKKGPCIPYGI